MIYPLQLDEIKELEPYNVAQRILERYDPASLQQSRPPPPHNRGNNNNRGGGVCVYVLYVCNVCNIMVLCMRCMYIQYVHTCVLVDSVVWVGCTVWTYVHNLICQKACFGIFLLCILCLQFLAIRLTLLLQFWVNPILCMFTFIRSVCNVRNDVYTCVNNMVDVKAIVNLSAIF